METDAPSSGENVDDVFHALAAPPRRELLVLLAQGDASVTGLADKFEISRPAISKHLTVLKRAGLVEVRQDGRKNVYRLDHEPLQDAIEWLVELDRFWARHVADIGDRLDEVDE